MHEENGPQASDTSAVRAFPVWKRALLILAAASVSLGFALRRFEPTSTTDDPSSSVEVASAADVAPASNVTLMPLSLSASQLSAGGTGDSRVTPELMGFAGSSSFAPTAAQGDVPDQDPAAVPVPSAGSAVVSAQTPDPSPTPWSPLFLKGGLSIFVGLCVGHAVRAFLKLSMIGLGVVFVAMLGLQYSGLLEIDWQAAEGLYDQVATRVAGELDSLRDFIAGSLPSAGLGTVGLIAGFKRSR